MSTTPDDIEYLGRFIDSLTDEEIDEINSSGGLNLRGCFVAGIKIGYRRSWIGRFMSWWRGRA